MPDEPTPTTPPSPQSPSSEETAAAPPARRRRAPRPASPQPEAEAAWQVGQPTPDAWTPRPWVPSLERRAVGIAARQRASRASQAALELTADRDPIAILAAQEVDRLQDLVPLRHGRMAESAFAYYRGTPAVMAADLGRHPEQRAHRPGQRRRPHLELRAVRFPRADPRLRRQRLRRDPPGTVRVGRQADGRERGHRGPRQRDVAGRCPGLDVGDGPRVSRGDGGLRRDAPARHLVRPALGRGHRGRVPDVRGEPRGRRPRRSPPGSARSTPSSPRPVGATGSRRRARSRRSSTAPGGSSTTRPWSATSRSRARRWPRSSRPTARRWPRTGGSWSSATGSSTSPSRWSAWAASGPAASSSSSKVATRTTR